MKKILFVSPSFSYGGSTTALISILNSSLAQEYRINVFSITNGDNTSPILAKYNIGLNEWTSAFYSSFSVLSAKEKTRAFGLKLMRQIPGLNRIVEKWVIRTTVKKLEKKGFDYVVAFQEKHATEFCQHFSIGHKIAWIHCDYARAYPYSEKDLTIYEKYQKIVCVSKATHDSFLGYFPTLEKHTVAVYNLFDADAIKTKSLTPVDDAKFDNTSFTIISVGRINHVKRFDLIPSIARKLANQGLEFKWYIIGQPYSETEINKLTAAIEKNKIHDHVIYLGGKPNPYPYFRAADLLVCVSESEACPMIFNEAKLLNLPIVSTDFPSAFEFIDEGINGYISSIDEIPEVLANYITTRPFARTHSIDFDVEKMNSDIILKISQLFDEKQIS